MKVLLNPRTAEAYGQDFLAKTLGEKCELATLTAVNGAYKGCVNDLKLVVSMNLDEKTDSDFVCALPKHVKTVAHVHCCYHFYSSTQKANLCAALHRVNIGIVTAEFHKRELARVFPKVDWRVIHNGIDIARYSVATESERCEFRQRLVVPDGVKVVLATGRLENAKGLQVLREFARKMSDAELVLVLQFPANSSRAKQAYEAIANELRDVAPRQVILYPDTDLSTVRPIRFADLFITPSLSEVAPLVVLEAFNAGVPVIGTRSTPFYDELSSCDIPTGAYTFVPFPPEENLNVERKDLVVTDSTASHLAETFIQLTNTSPISTYSQRLNLSQATHTAGFFQDAMLAGFKKIYDEALAITGT
ncbi:MAG: glycosyltransferase family 4 protein [Rhodoferax sp.]|nr:glycosyltransferase family 4 protein [Rhodoferax sp.]